MANAKHSFSWRRRLARPRSQRSVGLSDGWGTPRRWVLCALIAVCLLGFAAVVRGESAQLPWYFAVLAEAVAIVWFASTAVGYRVSGVILVGFSLTASLLGVLEGVGVLGLWSDEPRARLFTMNPNLLASDLAVGTAAVMSLRLPSVITLALVSIAATAVFFTASRTGFLALSLAFVAWILLPGQGVWLRGLGALATTLVLAVLAWSTFLAYQESRLPNLLHTSVTFRSTAWLSPPAARFRVVESLAPGPASGTTAERLVAVAQDRALVLFQHVELAQTTSTYVASLWMRSDTPQEVVVSSHLAATACEVGPTWRRCVTPPAQGDGHTAVQFRLETRDPFGGFDVYAWGPQVERADQAGPYVERGRTLFPSIVTSRLSPASVISSAASRVEALRVGVEAFATSPLVGVGTSGVRDALRNHATSSSGSPLDHTHNFLVDRLATDGLVGLFAWGLVLGLPFVVMTAQRRWRIVPLFCALLVTNTLDNTLFHSWTYASMWVALGVLWRRAEPAGRE